MRALDRAVTLHQIHALQRHVKPRVLEVLQEHKLAAAAIGLDLPESFELADAVIHVHHEITGLKLRKIAEKSGRADLLAGPIDGRRDVE